jgi:hypothetical protein
MRVFLAGLCLLSAHLLYAQEEPEKFTMRGYLKDMASFIHIGDSLLFQNQVHNRLNFAWYASDAFTVYAEIRTRILTGDLVQHIPGYDRLIDSNNDYFDLSVNVINNRSVLWNTMADRLYVQWNQGNWEIKVGRQRVNWGVNLAWNPNDLFNAYSYFDFDYEERPGSDAIRISYYTGVASGIEVAAKMADDWEEFVAAGMWKINKKGYDLQFLGGIAQGDLALGTGWAGNLGKAGFKGELTYFRKVKETTVNASYDNLFLGAVSVDYSFPSTLYLNGSVLFNSMGSFDPDIGLTFIGLRPGTVRELSPYKWSSFVQAAYQFSPLFYGSLSLIGYPGGDSFFLNPGLTISVKQNLDLDLIGQLFYGENFQGDFGALVKAGYIRIKWSF